MTSLSWGRCWATKGTEKAETEKGPYAFALGAKRPRWAPEAGAGRQEGSLGAAALCPRVPVLPHTRPALPGPLEPCPLFPLAKHPPHLAAVKPKDWGPRPDTCTGPHS